MKKTLIIVTLLLGIYTFGQNNKYQAFPITNNGVSATPISIPSPNNRAVSLSFLKSRMIAFSNSDHAKINACELLDFKNKELTIRVSHTIKPSNNKPIYVGAWFYDTADKNLDVGYIPKMIASNQSIFTDVVLEFNQFPITTYYLEVMLFQDGKIIAKRRFKTSYQWKEVNSSLVAINQMEKIVAIKDLQTANGDFSIYGFDLELSDITIKSSNNRVVPTDPLTCVEGEYHVFITNIGSLTSEPYLVSVGYYETINDAISRFIEIARFKKPTLLASKQTYCTFKLPHKTNNIEARIIYVNVNDKDLNSNNNSLLKRCKMTRN